MVSYNYNGVVVYCKSKEESRVLKAKLKHIKNVQLKKTHSEYKK